MRTKLVKKLGCVRILLRWSTMLRSYDATTLRRSVDDAGTRLRPTEIEHGFDNDRFLKGISVSKKRFKWIYYIWFN